MILTCLDLKVQDEVKKEILNYISDENIEVLKSGSKLMKSTLNRYTKVEKYSSGLLCNNPWIESIGDFCSFAVGTDVLMNHPIEYITTHNIVYKRDNFLVILRIVTIVIETGILQV